MGNLQGKERRDYVRKIDWKNAERPSPPGKPFLVSEKGDKPTDVITIRWSPPVTDGGAPILGYLVEHRRTGSPHWLRATPDLVIKTELPLTGLEPGWRYQFRVSADNVIGRSDPGELSEPLTVTFQKWAASAPFFNLELRDTIGLENEKVEFRVQVIGVPPPIIAWYKDGFEVFSSRRTKIVTENDQSTFIIHQAALEDEGEIKCTATNRAGHAVSRANLKLEAPPRIRLPRQYEEGLIFEKGELIRLKVTIAGRPKPEIFWYHDGELLQRNERIDMIASETSSLVKIKDACRQDRGEYLIKGVNKIGEDVVSFLVTVTDRPSPPGKVQVILLGRMVTLYWSDPDDDGGCKIGSYVVEYFRVGWDMWLKARNSRQLSTTLEDLIEGSEYKFRVRAENPYGISEPSEESDLIFIPDRKRGVLKPFRKPTTLELLKDTKRHVENTEETEEAKRRRLLEEKARKLLDTPLSDLLPYENSVGQTQEIINNENVPPPVPKRRKTKGRLTPSLMEMNLTDKHVQVKEEDNIRITPSPVYSNFLNQTEEITNRVSEISHWELKEQNLNAESLLKFKEHDLFCEQGPMSPRENDDTIMHGSSELMLVIYPRDRSKSVELSAQQRSEIEMNLASGGIAPPMSLSAPELGGAEVFEHPSMRDAVSSTELLYEKTAARLYQDSLEEEAQRLVKRRYSMDRKSVERRTSLKEPLEKRLSFKGNNEEEPRKNQIQTLEETPNHHPNQQIGESQEKSLKPQEKNVSERLNSVERERLEFAIVRDRLKQKEELPKARKTETDHGSETSTLTGTSSSVETEELEDEYEDDSLEEEEEEDYLDEDKNEKESNENYNDVVANITNELTKLSAIDTSLSLPKPIRITPFVEREENTYQPRSMISTRIMSGLITKLPADEIKTKIEPSTLPSEVVKPLFPPQSETKTTSKIPVSLKPQKTSKILRKFRLKKDKKIPEVTLTSVDQNSPPTVFLKPILKNKITTKKKESPKTLLKFTHPKPTDKSISEEESENEFTGKKKKQVRISEPNEETLKTEEEKPIDENARENQVLIFHYSDIVKEFGTNKKTSGKLYLNYDELKAHAVEPQKVNSLSQQNENALERIIEINKKEIAPEKVYYEEPKSDVSTSKNSKICKSQPKLKIHPSLEYLTDVIMFLIACCLFLFKNELYAIPILIVMAYRQLKDMVVEKYKNLRDLVSDMIPKSLSGKTKNGRDTKAG